MKNCGEKRENLGKPWAWNISVGAFKLEGRRKGEFGSIEEKGRRIAALDTKPKPPQHRSEEKRTTRIMFTDTKGESGARNLG